MAQHPQTDRPPVADDQTQVHVLTVALAVPWLIVSSVIFWLAWPDADYNDGFAAGRLFLVLIAILVPVGLIYVAVASAWALVDLRQGLVRTRAEVDRIADLQAAQSALIRTHAAQLAEATAPAQAGPELAAPEQAAPEQAAQEQAAPEQAVPAQAAPEEPAPQEPPTAQTATPEPPVSGFASRREVSRLIVPRAAPQAPADQPALALETPEETTPPIAGPDLIKALDFPDDENDTEGFAALRRALRDRGARKLVQASQDVLTLLSQDGIYMDDLRPESAGADLWRRFASGERGRSLDRLGSIKDQAYLSVISRRAREDAIFRDSVHHFLRCFDQLLVTFEQNATDTDLLELAETRTSRAFMLLGRATGVFD